MNNTTENLLYSPVKRISSSKFIPLLRDRDVSKFFSNSRLNTYRAISQNDDSYAIRLYLWNGKLSESFWLPFNLFEVGFRNLVSHAMTQYYGRDWALRAQERSCWTNRINPVGNLPAQAQKIISRTRSNITSPTSDCVIAQMTFGFWCNMFSQNYDNTLWLNGIQKVFPNCPLVVNKSYIYSILIKLRDIRNRIAHHELIFTHDPQENYKNLVLLSKCINFDVSNLIVDNSSFYTVLGARPLL